MQVEAGANGETGMTGGRPATPMRASGGLLAAVFLLAGSGLMFEVTLTRLFSATIWYHYTFVAISVALFGWGLGGFLVYVLRLARFEAQARVILVLLALLLAIVLPACLVGILEAGFTPDLLTVYFLLSLLPFLVGGAALSLAFETCGRDANRLYFADLAGAAAGTAMVVPAMSVLGPETTIIAIGMLPALAGVLLSRGLSKHRGPLTTAAVLTLALCVVLTAWNLRTGTLTVRNAPEKELYKLLAEHPDAHVDYDRWNAYSRITRVVGFDDKFLARLFIDSSAETSVLRWDGTSDDPPDADGWFRSFPFRKVAKPKVLVIGPGGGTDVVLAIATGAESVTAVELNPLIVEAVRGLGAKAGNLYDHPKVDLVMAEGRNYIERTDEKFDLIVLGWVDSWASVASGGLALTENYLYTRDALEAYYDHLSDDGAVAIIRWPVDVPRLVANCVAFLGDRGKTVDEIDRHLVAVSRREPGDQELSTVETIVMLSRSPMSETDVRRLLAGHDEAHVWHAPFIESQSPFAELFAGEIEFDAYTDSFPRMATPVHDDHPFYFAWDKPLGIPGFVVNWLSVPVGVVIVFAILLLAGGKRLGFRSPKPRTIAYFGALGAGFIVIEVALIQRLILLLGHPIYTLVVILFTLLLAGGLGSLYARRFEAHRIGQALGRVVPMVIVLAILAAFAIPVFVQVAMPLNLALRILLTALAVLPYGFLMGMPFPLGLRYEAQSAEGAPVSVLWGINGVASVVGSLAGVALAVAAGFTWVFLMGAACYGVALLARPK